MLIPPNTFHEGETRKNIAKGLTGAEHDIDHEAPPRSEV